MQILLLIKKNNKKNFLSLHFHLPFTTVKCYGIMKVHIELLEKFEFFLSFLKEKVSVVIIGHEGHISKLLLTKLSTFLA